MRILYWMEVYWPAIGGIEVLSALAIRELRRRGHEVVVVTRQGDLDRPAVDEYEGTPIHRFPFARALTERDLDAVYRSRKGVAELKKSFDPDLIHLNFSGASGYFHMATVDAAPVPWVFAVRHPLDGYGAGPLINRLLQSASWVTGNSMYTLESIRRADPEASSKSSVIFNALPSAAYHPTPLTMDSPRLVFVGRLVPEKGADTAVEAFARIAAAHPAARLEIVGDGPCRPALRALADRLDVSDRVEFTGWVSPQDVPAVLNRASVVIMPSHVESFGLVALEAGLMARPAVVSAVGGLTEVVADGETGLTAPVGDAGAFAIALDRLLSDPAAARRMGSAARKRALQVFSFDHYVDSYEALYRRLVQPAGAARRVG